MDSVKVNNQRSENPDKQKLIHNLKLDTVQCVVCGYVLH